MQEDDINEKNKVDEAYSDDYNLQYEQLDAPTGAIYQGRGQQSQRYVPLTQIYSDDMRISRILRRLVGEQQPAQALKTCDKLESAIRAPSNAAYICRSFEMLLDNLTQILKQCPIEIVHQVSKIIGIIGYINRANFPIYKNYIIKTYQNSKSLRKYLMAALKTTISCDAINLDLLVYGRRLLEVLIEFLENAEKAEAFIAISDTIAEFSNHYENAFTEKFTDIVDIVVGWLLETDQPQSLKLHSSLMLQRWAAYFLNELNFTYGLLGQFLEDIEVWLDNLKGATEGGTKKSREKAELRIAAFVGAFTTILKSLATPTDFVGLKAANADFVEHAVVLILKAAKNAFTLKAFGEEITTNINDFLSLILAANYKFDKIVIVHELIKLQLNALGIYNTQQTGSLLYVIITYIRHQRTALPANFLKMLLDADEPSSLELSAIKLSHNEVNYKLYLKIYHEILLLKNVPLLQEAYKHIKTDIHKSMELLNQQINTTTNKCGQFEIALQKINFYLSVLVALASQTSSIISMYALDPSMLELLIQNFKAADVTFWYRVEPCLHSALLRLLALHCQRNNNFVTTSRLLLQAANNNSAFNSTSSSASSQVLEEQIRNSPTSEHFEHILTFFVNVLKHPDKLTKENLNLLLDWLQQWIESTGAQMSNLIENAQFLCLCKHLCALAYEAPQKCADCLQRLISFMPVELLANIKSTALYMLNAKDQGVQNAYENLLAMLPLNVTLNPNEANVINEQNNNSSATTTTNLLNKVVGLRKWYQSTQHYAPLRAKYFQEFLDYFNLPFSNQQQLQHQQDNTLENIFAKCFIDHSGVGEQQCAVYEHFARNHNALLTSWIQCEAARYCVQNKLRTTVGKPQDTFLAIEAIVMKYARLLSSTKHHASVEYASNAINDDAAVLSIAAATVFQQRARLLLGFLEALEKQIYNAAHGTAFAMPAAEKPARTFFRINASTCNEWFKRIRHAVCIIAAHCMEPVMAIRNMEQSLTKLDQISGQFLENALVNLVESYLACNEADSLIGLHVWLRKQTGKSYAWIQSAAAQAGGQLEQAACHYKTLLDENPMQLDSQVKQFVQDQLLHCYYFTGRWHEMVKDFQHEQNVVNAEHEQQSKQSAYTSLKHTRTLPHLNIMQMLCFGQTADRADFNSECLWQLMDWSPIFDANQNNGLKSRNINGTNFSNYQIMQKLEDVCMFKACKGAEIYKQFEEKHLSELKNVLQEYLRASMVYAFGGGGCGAISIDGVADCFLLNHYAQKTFTQIQMPTDFAELSKVFELDVNANVLIKCMLWSLLVSQHGIANAYDVDETINRKEKLYLEMAAKTRQAGNYNFSRNLLTQFFAFKGFNEPLGVITQKLLEGQHDFNVGDTDLLFALSELTKCLYLTANPCVQQKAFNLAAQMCLKITRQVEESDEKTKKNCNEIGARTLHSIADWLGQQQQQQQTSNSAKAIDISSLEDLPQLHELLQKLPDPLPDLNDKKLDDSVPALDKAIGKLYRSSTLQKTDVAVAWLAYGNWCYRWGKKLVELKNNEQYQTLSSKNSENDLNEHDVAELTQILQENFSQELLSQISQVLQRHQFSSKIDAADDDLDANFSGSALASIEQDLREIVELRPLSSDAIMDIIRIWRRTHKNVYAFYEAAIRAYLKYLNLESASSSSSSKSSRDDDCGFVTTTLRILRLVVKHAFALQDVLEAGLNTTPLRPWKVIIPQLFSRLNHHEPYVRSSLSQLLCRLAQEEPHAVIFPAVVGSQQEIIQKDKINYGEESSRSTTKLPTASTGNAAALSNCFSALVSKLSEQAPQTVRHVQLLVRELRRVALLGEEYWLHALGRLLTEYSSVFSGLVMEMRRCNRANTAKMDKIKIKHELLLQYVVTDLQKIIEHTAKPPETKYEQSFKAHYGTHIEQTLHKLSDPDIIENAGPVESWQLLKNLYQRFQQRSMHGLSTAAATLKISDLSYTLGNMRDTAISMPGVSPVKKSAPIYIRAIENTVHILPSKTRPKKLVFLGSDGQKYTYLFKGLEDLHLDERIMQFLSISNLMMQRSRDRRQQQQPISYQTFRAHYYSVIPLGPQSGLISWVDGVTPLFAIYKKWQQRNAAIKQQQNKERPITVEQQQQVSPASSQMTALRPSELFYKKLRPLLASQNIKLKERKQWPLSMLRRVLDELSAETPNDLLAKELWCHATSAAEWHSAVRCYTVSTAVMSVIGYIIGLGDRHLDNVLINLHTGEIVHIDYNVCFEKGKTLRVPEKVPFRLTPNFENALGVTGVEGAFRLGCEYVLKTLRKEKETLLTLLEAFVYDPLVDWTVSDEGIGGGTTRSTLAYAAMQSVTSFKSGSNTSMQLSALSRESPLRVNKQCEMVQRKKEFEVMQQTIKNRFDDIRGPWTEYIDDVEDCLQKIENVKEQLKSNMNSMNQIEDNRNNLNQQVAIIREMEMLGTASGSHSLNTLTKRFQTYKQDAAAFAALSENTVKAQKDIENLLKSYCQIIFEENNNELMSLQSELKTYESTNYNNEFETLRAYVEKEISPQVIEDASFVRKEMENSLQQETRTANECLTLLLQYANVMKFYPRKMLHSKNGLFLYVEWYRKLLREDSNLNDLKTEVELYHKNAVQLKALSKKNKVKIVQYAGLLEKALYEIKMKSHKMLTVEENLIRQQKLTNVDEIVEEIQDFAGLDEQTCSTLQAAMLQLLNEASRQLNAEGNSANLSKEIDFIQTMKLIFKHLNLIPKSVQQISEEKLLKALESALKALTEVEQDFEFENLIELFFRCDDNELQQQLNELCKCEENNILKVAVNEQLNALVRNLSNKLGKVETELLELQRIVQEILDKESCAWFNILHEQLCVVRSLKNMDLRKWKTQTIAEIFSLAHEIVESLMLNRTEMIYDVRLLYSSIKRNIEKMYSNYLKGLTKALTEAYISSFQMSVVLGDCNNIAARSLCNKLLHALRHNFELSQLRMQISKNNRISVNFTQVASAYVWLNYDMLEEMLPNLTHVLQKASFLTVLGSLNQCLSAWQHTIFKIQADITQHTKILQQNLRLTATDVIEQSHIDQLMSKFDEERAMQTTRYYFFLQLATKLIEYVKVLLQFETLMDDEGEVNKQHKAADSFLKLIVEWQEIKNRYAQSSGLITPVEKSIVELLDPEDKADACWISNITGLLEELIFSTQKNLCNLEEASRNIQGRLYEYANDLQTLTDNPLRTDMRQLLRLILKNARHPTKAAGGVDGGDHSTSLNISEETSLNNSAREFLQLMKMLFGKLGELRTKLYMRENYDNEAVKQLDDKLLDVRNALKQQQQVLNTLIQNYKEESNNMGNSRSNSASPARLASPAAGDRKEDTPIEKKGTEKGEQKRNAYAVSVWKRIRMKLEGRDPDTNRRSSVAEQIDFIINEATNRDNLAVLYEGWTPWV